MTIDNNTAVPSPLVAPLPHTPISEARTRTTSLRLAVPRAPAAPPTATLSLPNGASVRRQGAALVARDGEGRVMLRFDGTTVELVAATNMVLAAPAGGVAIRCRDDVLIEARTIRQHAQQQASLRTQDSSLTLDHGQVCVTANSIDARSAGATLHAQRAEMITQQLVTCAQTVLHEVERLEVRAVKIVERARDVLRDTTGLVQHRSGRLRWLVERSYTLISERTQLRSRAETSIDGKKILLG